MRPVAVEAAAQARQQELKRKMQTWLPFGECRSAPELDFTPPYSEDLPEYEEKLKAVCSRCPVQLACLEHALKFPECAGIWGGLNAQERKARRNENFK